MGRKPWKKAFGILKSAFIFASILRLFDHFKKIIIEINTSDYTLRVVLSQKGPDRKFHPVAFYSQKTYTGKDKLRNL